VLFHFDHDLGAQLHHLGFRRVKAKVDKYVTASHGYAGIIQTVISLFHGSGSYQFVPLGGYVDVGLRSFPRFLLESVQHVHGIGELGDVDHSESATGIADSYFVSASAYRWHWFEVHRIAAELHAHQLHPQVVPHCAWHYAKIVLAAAQKDRWLHDVNYACICIKYKCLK
jgi:hypothetical protein